RTPERADREAHAAAAAPRSVQAARRCGKYRLGPRAAGARRGGARRRAAPGDRGLPAQAPGRCGAPRRRSRRRAAGGGGGMMEARSVDVALTGLGFGRQLRRAGLTVSVSQVEAFLRCFTWLDPLRRADVYHAASATLLSRREDRALFDRIFDEYWLGISVRSL